MSAAAPTADAAGTAKPAKGKKKLIIIVVAVLVLLLAGGGAMFVMKSKAAAAAAAAEAEGDDAAPAENGEHAAAHIDPKHPPTFLPLDPFVVNLADKESDRYAQIGITLEIDSHEVAEQMKTYMPAIRNNVLMILANKTSRDLMDRAGKEALAAEILRESVRPLGIEIDPPEDNGAKTDDSHQVAAADGEDVTPKKKKKKKKAEVHNPVTAVHFSNFIIQ
jgi:flagellar FliL protein